MAYLPLCLLLSLAVLPVLSGTAEARLAMGGGAWLPAGGSWGAAAAGQLPSCSEADFERRQAISRVLGEQYLLSREARHRQTPEVYAACAALAEQLAACPEPLVRVYRRLAAGNLSPRARAEVRREWNAILKRERVNGLMLRQFVESLNLPAAHVRQLLDRLPLGTLFAVENQAAHEVSGASGRREAHASEYQAAYLADIRELQTIARHMVECLSGIHDHSAAEAAVPALWGCLLQRVAMQRTLNEGSEFAGAAVPEEVLSEVRSMAERLSQEWERLQQAGYYDSSSLMACEVLLSLL